MENFMIIPATNKVNFYETCMEIGIVEPYGSIPSQELALTIKRFVFWAGMIATHPKIAEIFGEASTSHIKLATDLRLAIKNALKQGTFPNVVLPSRKFTTAMTLSRISKLMEAEIPEIIQMENECE
jgi:hypothetical protein